MITIEKPLDFYNVNPDCITYLYKIDSYVPLVKYSYTGQYDKFLCGVVLYINGYDYFAPISSFTKKQHSNMVIRNEKGKGLSSIRFSFMIPVPATVIARKRILDEPSPEYRRLLDMELLYCLRNEKRIRRQARYVYNTVVNNRDPIMVKNCCKFKLLETACDEYKK